MERSPAVAVLDPPDGRVNSGDGTTKSCATIPEDDETAYTPTEAVRVDGDLISIDRVNIVDQECALFHTVNITFQQNGLDLVISICSTTFLDICIMHGNPNKSILF